MQSNTDNTSNTLVSTDKMPRVIGNNCRNNILSNSLQMLSGAGTIESQNATTINVGSNHNF